ncbi:hypothetical protein FB45DRAFT_411916 [Roridomyces roridus]|uniref:Actin cytoskeleton-regulatory complex protein SLA1 n=1 Tax=Roridomyces roridus TaxID=1738132 RepID=A0AAD7C4K7_9AGAR|nr:hypothetical protein FB45DRAFT_411916 [Roridomyces roridus]
MDSEHHYLAVLKASYDYDPDDGAEDEISVKENQILLLKERVDQDWWKVKIKGDSQEEDSPVGLVPAAYVEPADHTSVVKALYDYEATAPGELSISEDQILRVFDTEEEWLLVQTDEDGGKAGFVPANYVEAHEENAAPAPVSRIVVPSSPPKPAYVDPAARVASSKIKADDIQTWSVSEVDKKGKKKKGTLGVGNGAVFFASESDKTPVQKWQTAHIQNIELEKSKHIHIDVAGPNPINLHFSASSKDNADAIVAKLESSKQLSAPSPAASPPPEEPAPKKASVHFAPESPTVIPVSDDEEEPQAEEEEEGGEEEGTGEEEGDMATALYDFAADGADELSVAEGEQLLVLERDGDEWWKCRNSEGAEGVVPASYLEPASGSSPTRAAHPEPEPEEEEPEEDEVDDGAATREAEARAQAERLEREKEKERAEKERKKQEAQKRAKEAELQRKKRIEAAEAAKAAQAKAASPPPAPTPSEPKKSESKPSSSSSSRTSLDPAARPPADRVRVWHDRSGQFRVDAAFLGFHNGKLRLHKTNGVIVEVPVEKMSAEDMQHVEKFTSKKPRRTDTAPPPRRKDSDDDVPLAIAKRASMAPPKKAPTIDWFDFFLSAGCDLDDCTRYAASFERDKMDEGILLDITDATMRSLGLREGDIIRVTKAIDKRRPAPKAEQAESGGEPSKPPPNLFTNPGGSLKNPRRGRPGTGKVPQTVDLQAISTVSDQIQRTSSPQVLTHVQPPPRTSSVLVPTAATVTTATTPASGFEDDAWTPRPSSVQPTAVAATPPAATPRAPSAPPAPAPAAVAPTPPPAPPAPQQPPVQPAQSPPSLARTTESDVFDQLARLSALRSQMPQTTPTPPVASPPPASFTPPAGYLSGMGMSSSPLPMAQHLNSQRTGFPSQPSPQPQLQPGYNGPRGPFAPVPANQSLLQPLIPTQTGFNSFIPTRPGPATSPFANPPSMNQSPFANPPSMNQSPFANPPPMQPSFLSAQPTGYPAAQPFAAQPTGFPGQQPLSFQPTGVPFGGLGGNNNGFVQSNPTGFGQPFNNGFNGQFNGGAPNGFSAPPPVPPLPSNNNNNNTTPANIFAQMKSGTFGAEDAAPQSSDRYDALRPNPMVAQATGWGGGYQNGGFH